MYCYLYVLNSLLLLLLLLLLYNGVDAVIDLRRPENLNYAITHCPECSLKIVNLSPNSVIKKAQHRFSPAFIRRNTNLLAFSCISQSKVMNALATHLQSLGLGNSRAIWAREYLQINFNAIRSSGTGMTLV